MTRKDVQINILSLIPNNLYENKNGFKDLISTEIFHECWLLLQLINGLGGRSFKNVFRNPFIYSIWTTKNEITVLTLW